MKHIKMIFISLVTCCFLSACAVNEGSNKAQGIKLEDAQQKSTMRISAPPNGSPGTPASESSASPTGASLGSSPLN